MIYLAAPLFSETQRRYNLWLEDQINMRARVRVFLPQRDAGLAVGTVDQQHMVCECDLNALQQTRLVVAVLDGPQVDDGTALVMLIS